jgi:hypothetical protein
VADRDRESLSAWEYRLVTAATLRKRNLGEELNRLGRLGWEVVGLAGSDRTVGVNSLEVLMKRPLLRDGWRVPARPRPSPSRPTTSKPVTELLPGDWIRMKDGKVAEVLSEPAMNGHDLEVRIALDDETGVLSWRGAVADEATAEVFD